MKKLGDRAKKEASLLSLLANGMRLTILRHLAEEEISVGELAEKVSLGQSALSQHLAKLRSKKLVETRRERQKIYYSCKSEELRMLLDTLKDMTTKAKETRRPTDRRALSGTMGDAIARRGSSRGTRSRR